MRKLLTAAAGYEGITASIPISGPTSVELEPDGRSIRKSGTPDIRDAFG